jgi:hypothetical protein
MYIFLCMYTHTLTHIQTHTYIYNTHTYMHSFIHTFMHTYMHTKTHTHTHTHTHTCSAAQRAGNDLHRYQPEPRKVPAVKHVLRPQGIYICAYHIHTRTHTRTQTHTQTHTYTHTHGGRLLRGNSQEYLLHCIYMVLHSGTDF